MKSSFSICFWLFLILVFGTIDDRAHKSFDHMNESLDRAAASMAHIEQQLDTLRERVK